MQTCNVRAKMCNGMLKHFVNGEQIAVQRGLKRPRWTREKLAEQADISVRTLVYMEEGRPTPISTITKVAKALGVPTESLCATNPMTLKTTEAFGPASSVFAQRGILSSAIGKLVTGLNPLIVPTIQEMDGIETHVAFVDSDALAEISGRINARAYRQRLWRGTGTKGTDNTLEKIERNRAHYQKNPHTLLLIRSFPILDFNPTNEYIGLTHVIPLHRHGLTRYRNGEIEDNLLGPDLICAPGEKLAALLLFSLALDTESLRKAYRGMPKHIRTSGQFKYQIGLTLLRSLTYHLRRMMEVYDQIGCPVQLLAQHDGAADLINVLNGLGFRQTSEVSGDHFPIWSTTCKILPSDQKPRSVLRKK